MVYQSFDFEYRLSLKLIFFILQTYLIKKAWVWVWAISESFGNFEKASLK